MVKVLEEKHMVRKITENDRVEYLNMTKDFYNSDAVLHSIDENNCIKTFDELMRSDEYALCFILEYEDDIAGYALLAKTFSQEAGGMVCWIEELYIKPEYRNLGIGSEFFSYFDSNVSIGLKRIRLEVEEDNLRAIELYKRQGYKNLCYKQMYKEL